jgi:xylulokinase
VTTLAAQTRLHAQRERVVEIEERAEQRVSLAGVLEDPIQGLAHLLLGCTKRGDTARSQRDPDRPAVAGDGFARDEAAVDQAVDDRGDRGLRDREPFGQQRGAFVSGGDQREHPELREGEIARRRGALHGAGRERQGPSGSGKIGGTFNHARQGTEPLESRTIYGRPPEPGMIPEMANALGIDVGTTNVKVALVRGDGSTAGSAQRPLPMTRAGELAEQDADSMWSSLVDAVREVTAAHPDEARDVHALGVCSQYSSIVPIDAQARPLTPMLMWQDSRGTDHCIEIMTRDENAFFTFVERHGIPPVGGGLALGHILYLQEDRPEVHERTAAYVEAMDYVTARLTGRITASQHSTYMYQLCDNRTLDPPGYDDVLVELAGVDTTRLPPLVPIDSAVGSLLPGVARELGLRESATVYAGTNDTATVAVATAAFAPGRAGISIGTTSVLVDEVDAFRVDLEHQIFSMPAPYPDRYVVCAENGLGGKLLEHVLRNLIYAVDELGDHGAADPFAALDDALHATRAGAGGVMFLPWLGGASAPQGGNSMRGGFVNMSLETTRRDLTRAVVEGIAHNLRALVPPVEAFSAQPIDEIALVGGAARSVAWCQVLADVLDRPVIALSAPDVAIARATALLALQRSGSRSRADLDREPTSGARRFEPDPEHRSLFADRHEQFEAAYSALLPISEALS